MQYPRIHPNKIKNALTGMHWRLSGLWLEDIGLLDLPGQYVNANHPNSPPIWIHNFWEYSRSLIDNFQDPLCLSLDLDPSTADDMEPILQMIPHLTALTGLDLNWDVPEGQEIDDDDDSDEEEDSDELDKYLGVLTAAQLDQLNHLALHILQYEVNVSEISTWLQKMPHLQTLAIRTGDTNLGDTLQIPPLLDLRQLYIRSNIEAHRLAVPVLPSLTRLYILTQDSSTTSPWLPNLAHMTALETLFWFPSRSELVALSGHFPPSITDLCISVEDYNLNKSEIELFWTNVTKLNQLTSFLLPNLKIPTFFLQWMKTSQISTVPPLLQAEPLLLAQTLPAMKHLRVFNFGSENDHYWMVPVLQKCTQLTRLNLQVAPTEISRFISALKSLPNLAELFFSSAMQCNIPTEFYQCRFPHLKKLQMSIAVANKDLEAFDTFMECHPTLTRLNVIFESNQYLAQTWEALWKCPQLERVRRWDREDVQPKNERKALDNIPPSMRRLEWICMNRYPTVDLPKQHLLTHFQNEVFLNNARRMFTLTELHLDWIAAFWPLTKLDGRNEDFM